MQIIDTAYGVDLIDHGDGFSVQLEDDPSAGASLTFAEREGFYENNACEVHDFTPLQMTAIREWFNEYEAA